jgi:hypothetical protein
MRLLLSSSVSDFQHDNADGHLAQPLASGSDQPQLTGGATSDPGPMIMRLSILERPPAGPCGNAADSLKFLAPIKVFWRA